MTYNVLSGTLSLYTTTTTVIQLHADVFTFTALLLWCCVSFCSLLDGVCLSGNNKGYLLTYLHFYSPIAISD